MRILLSGVPAFGHLLPFAPIARAAAAAGHDVRLLTSAGMTEPMALEIPQAPVLVAGPMPDVIFAEVARRFGGSDPARDPQPETVADFFAGSRVDLTADEAIAAAHEWQPDLVIAEATDFVGPLVAAALGVPWSMLAFGPAVPDAFTAPMRAVAASRYADRGLTATPPQHYLDPAPLSLQPEGWEAPARRIPFRSEPHRRGDASSAPMFPSDSRTRNVLVTLGTVFTDVAVLEGIVESIDRDRFAVVATTGVVPGLPEPRAFDGVTYVPFVPLAELLTDADVVVTSGGAGTVLATLSRGLPMVVLPQGADQFINAERAAGSGSAVVVSDPADVGRAVTAVADEPSFELSARAVADEMRAMPTPDEAVAELVGNRSALR